MHEQKSLTLEKIGQCIASAIVHTSSERYFREILSVVQSERAAIPLVKLKIYLLMIAIVIDAEPTQEKEGQQQKEKGLNRLQNTFKELKFDSFVRILFRYNNEGNYGSNQTEEIVRLGDAIVERASSKKFINAAKRATYEEEKRKILGSAASESNDSHLGRAFDSDSSYLT